MKCRGRLEQIVFQPNAIHNDGALSGCIGQAGFILKLAQIGFFFL